ncbi:glyoxylate reductase/hydroxypyruvate reductase-like isoform X2 [Daktulosphaira vitifoliae]|nr:glyoxylate reductase/hydroxypyruvate reductase-like isoform X2 [Daktulosphaira vitifoliae]
MNEIDEEVIKTAGTNLKVISTTSMGYDQIDLDALKKRGIRLGNSSIVTAESVAELTIGLLIATSRCFFSLNQELKLGKKQVNSSIGLLNSVVGIIGCGNIGISIANKLSAFHLKKLLYTSRQQKAVVESLGGQFVSIDELVMSSDYIILTSVLSPETRYTINRSRLSSMKSNVVIINIGRGQLIDQDALIDALKEKRIRGAGLDVMTPEPLPMDSPLRSMENVVLLPHIAGQNVHGNSLRKSLLAANNVISVLENRAMPCEVIF